MDFSITNYSKEETHVGEILLKALRECPNPKHINQIDAYTGEEETFESFLKRSVHLAYALRRFGAKPGDVLAIAGRNNIHVHVPYYAASYNGIAVVGVDPAFKYDETKALFDTTKPKIIFCESDTLKYMMPAAKDLNLNIKFVTFDGDYTMDGFIKEYYCGGTVEDFKVTKVDPKTSFCWLMSTSGTTGTAKLAAFTHEVIADVLQLCRYSVKEKDTIFFNLSPLQWASSYFNAVTTTLWHTTRLQMSGAQSIDRIVDAINKYKPSGIMCSAPIITLLLAYKEKCDLSCFRTFTIGGSKVHPDELMELRKRSKANVVEFYGQTETVGPVFVPDRETPNGSVGKPFPRINVKLVDPDTEVVINEPNKTGHLLVKGPRFTEYYNNPKATKEAFTDDGWYRTGDLLYRDENNYYFFVERIKMLIKYMNYHILPPELEEAIKSHEGVQEAVVVGLPHKECIELPVACVVRKPGSRVTAQEIKDIVANKFSEMKHLRGGVVFMDEMLLTSTGKIARNKLRDYVLTANRE